MSLKLLLFSDLHTSRSAAQRIVQKAQDVDILVGAGDFANMRHNLQQCIDILRVVERPTVLVAGNSETTDELRAACKGWDSAQVLHGDAVTIDGVTFYGIGGGIPITPFGSWSYDFTENEAEQLLANCPQNCVLVSHSPPQGAVDVSSSGQSLGSIAIRDAIQRVQPCLVVCGHIHASAGQQANIGSTPIINAGSQGVEWELAL